MLKPNDNTSFWTQIMAIPRHVTWALGNLQQDAGNSILVNANARENKMNVRGQNTRNKIIRNANRRKPNNNENESFTSHSTWNNEGEEAIRRLQEQVVKQQEIINNLLNQQAEPSWEESILEKLMPEGKNDQIQERIEHELASDIKKA